MDIEFEMWYHDNKCNVDHIVDKIIDSVMKNVFVPKHLPYDFTIDHESLRDNLIQYVYDNS
jgi:hypothetical protein